MNSVAFALPNGLELGGVTVWSINLARALRALGISSYLLEHIPEDAPAESTDDVDVARLTLHGAPFALNREEIERYASTYADALPGVIVPNYSTGTYATCAHLSRRNAHRMRVIGYAHTDEKEYYDHLQFYESIIHRFVAVSDEIRDRLLARIPHRANDVVVKPYGVDLPHGIERDYSSSSVPIRLVYAGRLVEGQKRVSDLMALVDLLHRREVDFTLTIAGNGEEEGRFHQWLAQAPATLSDRISMVGRLPHREMERLWRTSDLCVLTSAYEGCSIAMLEAMANGCVPVVTAVSGTRRFIRNGENGFAVRIGDVARMAEAIELLTRNRFRLVPMGRAATEAVAGVCGFSDYVSWFEEMTREVWNQPARAWPRYRPYYRYTFQEIMTRGSKYARKNHPGLFNLYEQVNYHVHRVLGRLPEQSTP